MCAKFTDAAARAFTLVELTLVMMILAVLAHLAVRECSAIFESRRGESADRLLDEMRLGVYDALSGEDPTGYLADVGTLACATNGTLDSLFIRPAHVGAYAVKAASAENLRVAPGERDELADDSVMVPTGWRGPYLKLPPGASKLRDTWGNEFVELDEAGLARLVVSNGFAVAAMHYGSSGDDPHRRSLVPDGGAVSRLTIVPVSRGGDASGVVTYRWYGPIEGAITGACKRAAYPGSVTFDGLTPGVRIVVDSLTRTPRPIRIRPGDNLFRLDLP